VLSLTFDASVILCVYFGAMSESQWVDVTDQVEMGEGWR
jgi:hypothetical protein